MSESLSSRPVVAVLPSLPPSPSLFDEVFSHPRPWSVRTEEFNLQNLRHSSSGSPNGHAKGKEKQTIEEEDEDEDDDDDTDTLQRVSTHEVYPPKADEAAETRRVEETLKRWELAERQRRRSARESFPHTPGTSFLSSVTRTAGLVLTGRSSIGTNVGPGNTHTFKSHDTVDVAREGYAVPLDDIDHARSSRDVAVHSPSPSPSIFDRSASLDVGVRTPPASGASENHNPFVHPSERVRTSTPLLAPSAPPSPSPFSDAHAQQAVQGELTTHGSAESDMLTRKRTSAGRPPSLPPPRPLGLPPPLEDIPHTTQLQPTSQPVLRPPPRGEEQQEVRWWHEWLCGCGEGPDRGGDNQAGRTNPFE